MKTIIKISILTLVLAFSASLGFAQKNMMIHKNFGKDYTANTFGIDSITFGDFTNPAAGLDYDSYTDEAVYLEHHAKISWTAQYKALHADLVGGFNAIHAEMKFNGSDLASSKFDGSVELSSINTFEPGRDAWGHCVPSSLGCEFYTHNEDTVITDPGTPKADTTWTVVYDSVKPATDVATLSAGPGDIVAYGDQYIATADFTYRGVTAPVKVLMTYLGTSTYKPTIDCHNWLCEWNFAAGATSSDPWYCGSSIKSTVYVRMNMMFEQEHE